MPPTLAVAGPWHAPGSGSPHSLVPCCTTSPVRALTTADRDDAIELCARDLSANVFVAARILRRPRHPAGNGPRYREGGRLEAMCWASANLVPVEADDASIPMFADRVRRWRRHCASILGPTDQVTELWRLLSPSWGPARALRPRQPLMSTMRRPSELGLELDERVRPATADEVDLVMPAAAHMFTAEIGYPPYTGSGHAYRNALLALIDRQHNVVIEDGQVIFKADVDPSPSAARRSRASGSRRTCAAAGCGAAAAASSSRSWPAVAVGDALRQQTSTPVPAPPASVASRTSGRSRPSCCDSRMPRADVAGSRARSARDVCPLGRRGSRDTLGAPSRTFASPRGPLMDGLAARGPQHRPGAHESSSHVSQGTPRPARRAGARRNRRRPRGPRTGTSRTPARARPGADRNPAVGSRHHGTSHAVDRGVLAEQQGVTARSGRPLREVDSADAQQGSELRWWGWSRDMVNFLPVLPQARPGLLRRAPCRATWLPVGHVRRRAADDPAAVAAALDLPAATLAAGAGNLGTTGDRR